MSSTTCNLFCLLFLTAACLLCPLPALSLPHAQPEEHPLPQEPPAPIPLMPLSPELDGNVIHAPPLTTTTTAPVEPEIPEYRESCFYADAELCLALQPPAAQPTTQDNQPSGGQRHQHRDINSCQCRAHPTVAHSWYCCNITHMSMISSCSNTSNWSNLHIRNVTLPELDLSNSIYQTLQSLAITDGNITGGMVGAFSRVSSIKCLNISNNNVSNITLRAFGNMPNLKILDISKNNLTRIPNFNKNQNITVDVSGNNHMLCDSIYNYIFRESLKFVNQETSFCLQNFKHQWFNSSDSISIKELAKFRPQQTECPVIPGYGNCTCTRKQNMVTTGDQSEPSGKIMCEVDCSNLGLIELPPKLPENTFFLNVSNNKITSFGKHFHSNPTYQSLVYLVADNNQISSMYEWEGTPFMYHFQRLYLRNNALSSIPEYLLNNVLDNYKHYVGHNILLGGNKLQCDCNSAKVLKYWLLEHMRDIPDYNQILCRNLPQRVVELREVKLCQSPHDWSDYIYYLIAAEVLLLMALITKVSYDYWVFKTAGYLPWPASKMPKLPCDWLCES